MFRVDLRLRPEGTGGPLALPLPAYRQYHETRGALWERQALIKARVAAGDERLGRAFLELARTVAYRSGVEREAIGEIRAVKARIDRTLRARGSHERHVKLGVGGIRDVEFHVQALQLLFGARDPWLQERNTLRALHRLAERGYLVVGGVGGARPRLHVPPHGRAPPPDPPRAPDPHAARRPRGAGQAGPAPRLPGRPGPGPRALSRRVRRDPPPRPRRVRGVLRGADRRQRAGGRAAAVGRRRARRRRLRRPRARPAEPRAPLGGAPAGAGARAWSARGCARCCPPCSRPCAASPIPTRR